MKVPNFLTLPFKNYTLGQECQIHFLEPLLAIES